MGDKEKRSEWVEGDEGTGTSNKKPLRVLVRPADEPSLKSVYFLRLNGGEREGGGW